MTKTIDNAALSNVRGGIAEQNPPAGPVCTPDDQRGERFQRYFQNPPPGQDREPGHGGGHYIHPDPPVEIRQPRPLRPVLMPAPGRSDRRLKRRIRAL